MGLETFGTFIFSVYQVTATLFIWFLLRLAFGNREFEKRVTDRERERAIRYSTNWKSDASVCVPTKRKESRQRP